MRRLLLTLIIALALVSAAPLRPIAHESPVDHVDRGIRIWISGETIHLRYQVQLSERAAMMQLHKMDGDSNGAVSDSERDAYLSAFSDLLSKQLHLQLDGKDLALKFEGKPELLPHFRQTYLFTAPIGALTKGKHPGQLNDNYSRSYPGMYRWDGPKFETGPGPRVIVTDAPNAVEGAGHAGSLRLKFEVIVP